MASEKGECTRMPAQKMRQAPQPDRQVCRTLADGNSKILSRLLSGIFSLPALLGLLLIAGCSSTDPVTSTVRAPAGLPKPDRVLVHDFEVANADTELSEDLVPPVARGTGAAARTEEEMRVGRAAGKVLTASLVQELKSRGIVAQPASEAAPPEMNTLSIRGRFLWREKDAGAMRARIWFYQGSGVNSRLVAQAEADIPSESKPSAKLGEGAYIAAQEADARRMARELAERVARYYREQGWI